MKKEVLLVKSDSDIAFELFQNILDAKHEAGKQFLKIGEALVIIQEKEWYKYFDADSFEAFLAIPELGFARSTARLFMHVYELYIRRLGLPVEQIASIEISKLQKIAPVVERDPEEWLSMASTLSRSDLENAIRKERGLEPLEIKEKEHATLALDIAGGYLSFVQSHPCIVCDNPIVDAHHFPRTKGAGGLDHQVIPLCRECHTEYHNDPHEFLIKWEEKIFDYFYRVFVEAYKIIAKGRGEVC